MCHPSCSSCGDLPDVLQVKRAMLDSANDTIASLKAELGDLSMEAEEARRAAEEAEASAARSGEEDAIEKGNLRYEGNSRGTMQQACHCMHVFVSLHVVF
jgi:leucine-rich repeat/coiled-coil domain-containing protein 1